MRWYTTFHKITQYFLIIFHLIVWTHEEPLSFESIGLEVLDPGYFNTVGKKFKGVFLWRSFGIEGKGMWRCPTPPWKKLLIKRIKQWRRIQYVYLKTFKLFIWDGLFIKMKFISILLLTAMVTIAMEKYTARYLLVEIDDGKHCLFSCV